MVRGRIWQTTPSDSELDGIESRFPPGSRSGEGSHSLQVFLEAARKARPPTTSPSLVHQRRRDRSRDE